MKADWATSMVNVMLIASAKFRRARGASHQPVFMGSCLTISHRFLPCLSSRTVSLCVLCSLMIGLMRNGGPVDVFCMVSVVIVLWEVTTILGNGCGIQGQKYVAWLQGSKIPLGFHDRNLILGIQCFNLITLNMSQWSNG